VHAIASPRWPCRIVTKVRLLTVLSYSLYPHSLIPHRPLADEGDRVRREGEEPPPYGRAATDAGGAALPSRLAIDSEPNRGNC
jgi:hypothetical protein